MRKFAEAVRLASKYREESFDHQKADMMSATEGFDYRKCYTMSLENCVTKAVNQVGLEKEFVEPIYMLVVNCWNQINLWAKNIK